MNCTGPPFWKTTGPTCTFALGMRGGLGALADARALDRRGDEVAKQRVRRFRPDLELRMELDREEPRMVLELDDLHEVLRGMDARDLQAGVVDELAELVVDLEAVAMA